MQQDLKIEDLHAAEGTPRRGSNQSGMRNYNERLVLSLIRRSGPMAKAEIARRTGLSAQTVSVIMRALEADGLLKRGEPVRGKIGQPSIPMSLAKDGAFFLGLKVGRRSLDLVLTDFLGTVQHRMRLRHAYPTPDKTVQFANDAIFELVQKLPKAHRARIAGLGIALPFQLWEWAGVLGVGASEMQGWQDRDIAAEIGADWDFPVFMCNDATAACGAELVFGDQSKPDDFLYIFVGFFIGGSLVLDSSLYTGRSGNAAALGSIMVPDANGGFSQLVDLASLATLEETLIKSGKESAMIWDQPDSWDIPQAALEAWMSTAASSIAHAILSSTCLIDVQCVLLDGWLPPHMRDDLLRRTQTELARIPINGIHKPDVRAGSIGSDARVLGAASLPLSKRFLIERNSYQKGPST